MKNPTNERILINEFIGKADFKELALLSRYLTGYKTLVEKDLLSSEELIIAEDEIKKFQEIVTSKIEQYNLAFKLYEEINFEKDQEEIDSYNHLLQIQKKFSELLELKHTPLITFTESPLQTLLNSFRTTHFTLQHFNNILESIDIRSLNYSTRQFDPKPESEDDLLRQQIKNCLFSFLIRLEGTQAKNTMNNHNLGIVIQNLLFIYTNSNKVLLDINPFIKALKGKDYSVLTNINHHELELSVFIEGANILRQHNATVELQNLTNNYYAFISQNNNALLNTEEFVKILNRNCITITLPSCSTHLSNPNLNTEQNTKQSKVKFNDFVRAKAIPEANSTNNWHMNGSINISLRPDISEMQDKESGFIISTEYSNVKRKGVVNSYVRINKESWVNALKEATPTIVELA